MALGAIAEFKADWAMIIEDLAEFEALIFEQCNEVTTGHFDFGFCGENWRRDC
jgi:hypothetical protein